MTHPECNSFDDGQRQLSAVNRVVLDGFIAAFGCNPRDFEVAVDEDSQLSRLLGLNDRFVSVRQVSTGVERIYVASDYAEWLADLIADVRAGVYRCAGARPVPLTAAH
jgi:hypothetical protein